MADQKISALTAVTAPVSTDVLPIVNSSTTKKVTIADLVKAAPAIWARVYHNAAQSIPNAIDTTLNFNSERADTDVIHDNVTNNPRLTCKTAGVYYIVAGIGFASNATGRREVFIRLNGATQIASAILPAASGVITRIPPIGTLYPLAVNDYVEVIVNQTSGGALNTDVGANATPEFMMIRLGGS